MTRRIPTISACLAVVLLTLGVASATDVVTRPLALTSAHEDIVLLRFRTCGESDRAGRGIAVLDSDGKGVACRLISHDPDGETVLAVDVRTAPRPLSLTYGTQPSTQSRQDPSLIPSLVVQTFPLARRAFKDGGELVNMIAQAKPMGTAQINSIFMGSNPFGPQTDFITLIQGRLTIETAGEYWFAPIHDDAAVVEIDGKNVYSRLTANTGFDSERVARQADKITLDAGTHTLRFLHAQTDGGSTAVLAMRPPDNDSTVVAVPAERFVHDPELIPEPATARGEHPAVGFDAAQVDQIAHEEYTFTRFKLRPIAPAPPGTHYRFDFTDGTNLSLPESDGSAEPAWVERVFVGGAAEWPTFRVSMELVTKEGKSLGKCASSLRTQMFDDTGTIGDTARVEQYAAAITAASYSNAKPELLVALFQLVDTLNRIELTAPLAEAFVARFGERQGKVVDQMKELLALHVSGSDPQRAAKLFEELSTTTSDPWQSATASAEEMDLMIFRLGRAKEVPAMVAKLSAGKGPREKALLQARLGDSLRVAGKLDDAEKVYRDAQPESLRKLEANKAAVQERACREKALSLFEQKRYPELHRALLEWEADFPIAKLGGDLPVLRGRYFQVIGDDARAEAELRTILALNPMHPGTPEITFRLAQSLMRLNRTEEATAMYDKVAKEFPNSPFAARAAARDVER
ncbi:MAG: hypothetical protein K8S99_04210 [Planctomycetes bacterium]|nr:hypothetical protein [Planctomycetota bacterium]